MSEVTSAMVGEDSLKLSVYMQAGRMTPVTSSAVVTAE